jgi:drug/metabolite transporter (DMT)-like permease
MALVFAWSVLALSLGAIGLLLLLIRRGEVSRRRSSFIAPPTAAIQAYFRFGERLSALQLLGMAATAAGVAIANRR